MKRLHLTEDHKHKISEALKGKIVSEETKKKMRESHKGVPRSEEIKRKISESHKGKPHLSEEAKKRLSEMHKGSKCNLWKGGISRSLYPPEWKWQLKRGILQRDNYACQLCGAINRRLHIHHIDYNKNNCATSNLITLCRSCHGKTQIKRDWWQAYFIEILHKEKDNVN